jgi:PAS domain S-box-containing protein
MENQLPNQNEGDTFKSNEHTFLYNLFMDAPAGIAIVKGATHIYEFANKEYNHIVNRAIVIGKTVQENLSEIEQHGIIDILNEVFATGKSFVANDYPIHLTKEARGTLKLGYYNIVVQAIKNTSGTIERLMVHAVEVTAQVEAQKIIEESEKRYTNLLLQSIMAIALLKGPDMKVAFTNDKMLAYWGKGNAVIGKKFCDLFPELEHQGFWAILDEVYTTGVPYYGYEAKAVLERNNKKETLYYNFVYEPYTEVDHTISGITMLATDVTDNVLAKKQMEASEAFNRSILQSSPDCLKVLDSKGQIQFMNVNGLCQMEIDDFKEVQNKVWSTLWDTKNQALVNDAVQKALTGETVHFTALCFTLKGTPKWWDVRVSPVANNNEEISQIISVSRDITEQRNAEEEIKKMAAHLKLATDSANVGVWSLSLYNQELEWSSLHKKMWGYDKERSALVYADWHSLIVAEDKEPTFAKVEESRINQALYDVEYRIKRANDHKIRIIRSVGKYLYDANGAATALTGISVDITKQKVAEQKIKESENQFRLFANSIQNLAWIADGDGITQWYNQKWYDYTGCTIAQMNASGWKKVCHPDHAEQVICFIEKAQIKEEPWELSLAIKKHDGTYRWFLTRAYPVKDENGNVERWIGTSADITEQKNFTQALEKKVAARTEELSLKNAWFELAEKTAQFGTYRWNASTGTVIYSDNLYRLLDYEPQEFSPSFEKFLTFIHPEDLEHVINDAEYTVKTGETLDKPYRIITKTGVIKYVSTLGNYTGEGPNRSFVGVIQDVTKTINDAEELRTKNMALENLNAELKSFAFIASHDLQEPLRKIQTFGKRIMQLETFSDETQHYFDRIVATSERMQKLVVSLLDFSSTNTKGLNGMPCDINVIIEESKIDLNLIIKEQQATIAHEHLPEIKGNHMQLSQLFTNLIGNAIKYRRPDVHPHVKISTKLCHGTEIAYFAANKHQEYLVIQISDNGIGFDQQFKEKIFEPFQRLHAKHEFSGTGIGLAIVKKIVSNHNGFVTAEGQLNVGSTFTVYLPT